MSSDLKALKKVMEVKEMDRSGFAIRLLRRLADGRQRRNRGNRRRLSHSVRKVRKKV